MNSEKQDKSYEDLISGNRQWVARRLQEDPDYFKKLASGQRPHFLWIGCADSRAPANELTGTQPGEVFVHRNIANLVVNTDTNMLSVLQYSIEVLKVNHVIVCGHYGCGGISAALSNRNFGIINTWLRNIKDVYRMHREELRAYTNQEAVERRLVELNVIEQVYNLCKTSFIQKAWHETGGPEVHGWVYAIDEGKIRDLGVNFNNAKMLDEIYRYDFSAP